MADPETAARFAAYIHAHYRFDWGFWGAVALCFTLPLIDYVPAGLKWLWALRRRWRTIGRAEAAVDYSPDTSASDVGA